MPEGWIAIEHIVRQTAYSLLDSGLDQIWEFPPNRTRQFLSEFSFCASMQDCASREKASYEDFHQIVHAGVDKRERGMFPEQCLLHHETKCQSSWHIAAGEFA
ncbi:MAG TPA: hypothetical protein VHB45_11760 [Alloacidobacterium sp.]|nr:hypothetical protein [Alloacidobacterium sp.]